MIIIFLCQFLSSPKKLNLFQRFSDSCSESNESIDSQSPKQDRRATSKNVTAELFFRFFPFSSFLFAYIGRFRCFVSGVVGFQNTSIL